VVVRLDRLARSVSHLLAVIEQLEAAGAHFRSLRDPIDTFTPQGMFSLQVLGAVAQLERALIAERTKSGLAHARAAGSMAIPACPPAIQVPSEKFVRAAMPHISKASWRGLIPGCRPCGKCARSSRGTMSCGS
jgi:DNA invertase Pin-like site-specific DNA recombinase